MERRLPNILVTGVPGTGKTTLCRRLLEELPGFRHVELGKYIHDKKLYKEWDDKLNVPIVDDDMFVCFMDSFFSKDTKGGMLVDFHSPEDMRDRWFDLVIVLTTETSPLYDRLAKRGYQEAKIKENIQAEIFGVVTEQVHATFNEKRVEIWMRSSNDDNDREATVKRVKKWYMNR